MKKRFLVCCALAGVMALGGLTACGGQTGDGGTPEDPFEGEITEDVTINFWGWGDVAEQENFRTLVNQFMAEEGNEHITVVYTGRTAENHMSALQNSKNSLPQLFLLPDYEFYEWADSGVLKDLTPYFTEEDLSLLWPHAVDEYYYNPNTAMLGKSDGAKLYALPKDLGPYTLVYNKTLLDAQIEANNLDREEVYELLDPSTAMTWQQFRDLLKDLTPGLSNDAYGISHYEVEAAVYSNDANFFNDEASEQKITDQNFIDALQFIADLALVDHTMTPAAEQDVDGFTRFLSGKCIFTFMGPWDCSSFWSYNLNFTTNILPVPYNGENPNAKSTAWVGSMGYCISNRSNSLQTTAALRLAKYLSTDEAAQRKFYSLGQQVPNLVEMANGEYLTDSEGLLAGKDPADRSVWVDTIDGFGENDNIGGKTRIRYYTYSSLWYTDFTDYISDQGLWTGKKTAKEICEAYAPLLQRALDNMRYDLGIG